MSRGEGGGGRGEGGGDEIRHSSGLKSLETEVEKKGVLCSQKGNRRSTRGKEKGNKARESH